MTQDTDWVTLNASSSASIGIAIVQSTPTGTPIVDPLDAIDAMRELGLTVDIVGTVSGAVGEMTVVDFSGGPTGDGPEGLGIGDGDGEWSPPQVRRAWLAEVDGGVLLVSAGTLEAAAPANEVIALGDAVAPTVELTADRTTD